MQRPGSIPNCLSPTFCDGIQDRRPNTHLSLGQLLPLLCLDPALALGRSWRHTGCSRLA